MERNVIGQVTDPRIAASGVPHIAINPSPGVPAARRLFVMLPGTIANPTNYREIIRVGAAAGYHVIGLDYPNDNAVETTCRSNSDPECTARFRHEVITGQETSPLVAVDEANSIINRLTKLLNWLTANAPNEGWEQYLTGSAINWHLVTVAGHSQGGGHAAYLGKLFALNRVVMFSSPGDTTGSPAVAAPWMSRPGATPPGRHYGFTHEEDPLIVVAIATAAWQAIEGRAVAPFWVDGHAVPFGGARYLLTRLPPNPNPTGPTASPLHGAPVVDSVTPRFGDGTPVYRSVWEWMAFPAPVSGP